MPYEEAPSGGQLQHAVIASGVGVGVRFVMIGSGITAAMPFYKNLTRMVREQSPDQPVDEMPLGGLFGFLGLAMFELLEGGVVPGSGGGIQLSPWM